MCSMNSFPTILPASQSNTSVSEAEREQLKTKPTRKPPTEGVIQPDERQRFKQMETRQNLEDINNTCINN